LIGASHLQYHPSFDGVFNNVMKEVEQAEKVLIKKPNERRLIGEMYLKGDGPKSAEGSTRTDKTAPDDESCKPSDVNLLDFPQWKAEKGYWIGEYTFLQGDGNSYASSTWNYPYDHYKGFITGQVVG
jgi:hypothetical protein